MEIENDSNSWKIDIEKERLFIKKYIIGLFIIIPTICPHCKTGAIGLRDSNSINNPILGKCNNFKCTRNIFLRKGSLFQYNPKTPMSVIYNIIKLWLLEEKNCLKIKASLEDL